MLRFSLGLLAIFLLCVCRSEPPSFVVAPNDLWIRDVTVISSERETPLAHAQVVVRGEKIAWIGTEAPSGISALEPIEGTGMYLVPGLIDGHVHLGSIPGMSREQAAAMPELAEAYYRQLPRSYLYFGFTTIVDVNVMNRAAVERVRTAEPGPVVLDCGGALVLANGYPMRNHPFPERFGPFPNFLYDPSLAESIPSRYRAEDHSPEAVVGRVADAGGKCVKAFFELGPGDWPVPTVAVMRQVRELSHQRGLPLLLHANSLEAHRFAVDAGVDAVAHGLWNWFSLGPAHGAELPLPVREVLDDEREAGIGYMPSMRVLSGIGDLFDPAFLDREDLAHVFPPAFLDWLRTPEARWYADEMTREQSVEDILTIYLDPARKRATTYVATEGGRILFGSDTPSDAIYTNPPGYNGYLELREMEAASVTPRQILAAATIENARLFGIEDRYGTVEEGKVANLLLLREDPLASASAFDAIETVILAGRAIPRAELSASP